MPKTALDHKRDNDLALRAAQDKEAFSALYELYFSRIYNYMRYRCNDPVSADDLTAQVFEQMLANIKRFDPERASFNAWLFGIARNIVSRHRRNLSREKQLPLEELTRGETDTGREIEMRVLKNTEIEDLIAAIQDLDDNKRELLALKFAGRLTNRQISALTGLSESNVGVILFRTINQLRVKMESRHVKGMSDSERHHE